MGFSFGIDFQSVSGNLVIARRSPYTWILMTCELEFIRLAKKEWDSLDHTIKKQLW